MTYDVRAGFRGYVQFNKYTRSSRDTVLDKGNQRYTTAVPTRTESVKRIYGASLDVGCTIERIQLWTYMVHLLMMWINAVNTTRGAQR